MRGPMCAMTLKTYGWDLRNEARIDQGTANCELFQIFKRLSARLKRNFLQSFYTTRGTYLCNDINIAWLGFEKQSQK